MQHTYNTCDRCGETAKIINITMQLPSGHVTRTDAWKDPRTTEICDKCAVEFRCWWMREKQ